MHLDVGVEIDTENYSEAKRLILELHKNFFGLLNGKPEEIDVINAELSGGIMDEETKKALGSTDWGMQKMFDRVKNGETIPIEEWQKLSISDQNILHKAQLQYAQKQRLDKKDANK